MMTTTGRCRHSTVSLDTRPLVLRHIRVTNIYFKNRTLSYPLNNSCTSNSSFRALFLFLFLFISVLWPRLLLLLVFLLLAPPLDSFLQFSRLSSSPSTPTEFRARCSVRLKRSRRPKGAVLSFFVLAHCCGKRKRAIRHWGVS